MPKGIKIITDDNLDLSIVDIGGKKVLEVFDLSIGDIESENGLGAPFKKISYASTLKQVQKGGKTKITIRPRVLIENMIDDTNNVQELGAGGITDVGQVFRLTGGIFDIDRVHLTLEAIAGGAITAIDNFESYADTAALRAVWVSNDTTNTPNTLETTIVQEGTKAMKVDMPNTGTKSKGDDITKTFGANQDWSAFDGIQFQFRNDGSSIIEIHIEDSSGDGSKQTITVSQEGIYEFIKLNFSNFVPVGAIPADLSMVKKIKFVIKTPKVAPFYLDIIEIFSTQSFGNVDLELHDFGTDPTPTSLGMPLVTKSFDLQSGKRTYEIEFKATGLTPNNFFGLVLTNPSVATVKVFGKNGSDQYASGFAFDSSDNGASIASTGSGDDMFFLVFALDKAIFNGIRFTTNATPGQGKISAFINDNASQKGRTSLFLGESMQNRKEADFPTKTQTGVGIKINKNELVLIAFEDDASSLVTKLQATVYFTFIDRPLNG